MKKLLLDAMLPRVLADEITIGAAHVAQQGWQQLQNGKLLAAAEDSGFDVLITRDGNMPYQQNLSGRKIALVVVKLHSQKLRDLLQMAKEIEAAAIAIQPGEIRIVVQIVVQQD